MSQNDKPVEKPPVASTTQSCLHGEAMDAMKVNGSGSFPRRYPESVVGDDVSYDTRRIYESNNPGLVGWYASDGLNNLVLNAYARGHQHELDLQSGKICLSNLTQPQIVNLERYRALHDALLFKANEFATESHGTIKAANLMHSWESNTGFYRKPDPPPDQTWHHIFKCFPFGCK
jgi:hypothetical protein